jgi:hypothetical protein
MFLVDLEQGRIVDDEEIKREVATRSPTASGSRAHPRRPLADLPRSSAAPPTEPLRCSPAARSATRRRT